VLFTTLSVGFHDPPPRHAGSPYRQGARVSQPARQAASARDCERNADRTSTASRAMFRRGSRYSIKRFFARNDFFCLR